MRDALQQEVQQLQEAQVRQMEAAKAALEKALERQRAELTGSAEEQAAAREAREREERVEALAGKAMRRIAERGHHRWLDARGRSMWEEADAGRSACWRRRGRGWRGRRWRRRWRTGWPTGVRRSMGWALARSKATRRGGDGAAAGGAMRSELASCDAGSSISPAAGSGEGGRAEGAEQLRAERRARREAAGGGAGSRRRRRSASRTCSSSAMRRIANAGIASGFSAWQEQWEEVARQKRMLAAAGARLARPALAAAVAHWRADWALHGGG